MPSNSIKMFLFLFIKIECSLFMHGGIGSIYKLGANLCGVRGFYYPSVNGGFKYLSVAICIHFSQDVDEQKLFFKLGNFYFLPQRNHCVCSCQEYQQCPFV